MRAKSRSALAAAVLAVSGCACGATTTEVRWPASPDDVSLASVLLATARAEGRPPPVGPNGQRIEGEPLPRDAPGIRARSFVFEGIWAAELELGEAPDGAALPLVVMFHGRGDRPRIPGGPFTRVPTPIRVIVPRGPLGLGAGYAWARHSVTQNRHDELADDLVAITDRLIRLVDHVRRTRPTAGDPIVTGFSQGAMVAWTLAVRHPDRVGAALPMAGWVPPRARPDPLRAPPTRSMHGTADRIVRIEPTRAWVHALRDAGNEVVWEELEGVEHVVTPGMNQQLEAWLEELARERAPDLSGGLGAEGADPEPMELYEPPIELDPDEVPEPAPLPEDVPLDEAATDDEGEPTEGPPADEAAPDGPAPPAEEPSVSEGPTPDAPP